MTTKLPEEGGDGAALVSRISAFCQIRKALGSLLPASVDFHLPPAQNKIGLTPERHILG
jgi:hypothetical protein